MRKRTLAREYALQVLYQVDLTGNSQEDCLENFWQMHKDEVDSDEVRDFSRVLVAGVLSYLEELDRCISKSATNWKLERMAVVDRNILRMGCFELIYRKDIPPKVAINEAIELAKKYSSQEAAKFVNGILDKIHTENKE
mgnify:CR=1 FL=1